MRDLTCETSSLLQFPDVTIQALGEDEIATDCIFHGKLMGGRNGLACLACGPQLEIVSPVTGERLSAYHFSGVNEQLPTILTVKEFSWQKRNGLLIGLEETEGSVLCLYDLGISRVVKAVVLPGRVTAIEPVINHGGASLTTQHLHPCLRWLFGVAAVVTDVGHVLLIDLCLDDLSCNQNEIEASDLEVITGIPSEIPQVREAVTRKGRHLCFQLLNPSGTAVTTLSYIQRSNQLVVGFSDGYLSLWNMKSLKKEYHFQLEGGRIPVYAVTFQEPENDPRNCCYLWAIQSTQESEGDILSLHLLQLAFSDRRRLASGQIMYEGLEYCEERYSLDLTGGVSSLRGQTSNTKLIGCQSIEKFRSHVDREESINEVISPDTSVTVFTWQVNTYGQGKPSTYLGIFDINRWYHAQMPDSLRPGEFLHNCPYFALWSLDAVGSIASSNQIFDVLVHERSFCRGVPPSYPPPEQFFNPRTYNFDATCLLNCGIIHVSCTGFQKDTLRFLKKSGCLLNETIPEGYSRCLTAGLLSPRFIDIQSTKLSQEEQFEAVLSAAIQTSSLGLVTSCIKQWTTGEQPHSHPNLHFILEWAWSKVVNTKEDFIRLCTPLFDGSSNFIDPQTLQSLQRCELLLSNLSTVLNCFMMEARELTEKGVTDLTNKHLVTSLLSRYLQVVIWFCRSNLLPENLEEDMHLSKPFYNYQHIQQFYIGCRQKLERSSRGKWNSDCLMIDGMISQLGDQIVKLWQKDDGGTGKYPPPSLHALLDLYLLENIEELYKHAITIYLLLDIMHSCPNRMDTSMDSFPTAFAVPIGLVNLIQGFWCLDHNDYENSLSYLFHPATIKMPWQHMQIIQALMCQGEHRQALRYIQMMKPSLISSSEVELHLTVLLFNSCIVEAWSVLRQHSTQLNIEHMLKRLYEICQELGLMEDLLKLPFTETEQECLEKFLQTSTDVSNHEYLLVHHLQRANYIPALQLNQSLKNNLMNNPQWRERSIARNSILEHYGKVLPRVQRKLAVERSRPYHLTSSLRREILRPKPLSTVAKQIATGNVITKATFINNVLSKIGEVWIGNQWKNKFQSDTPEEQSCVLETSTNKALLDPFVGTPVTTSLRKCSRLLDLTQPIPLDSPPSGNSILSNPLHSNSQCSIRTLLHKNITRAPELKLLETPPVVKRAKALASISSGFPGFTPQSILRSSVRTTPLATPTASPGRSITPPLRAKETKISFVEENTGSQWSGVTDHELKCHTASSKYNLEAKMEENRETPFFSVYSLQNEHEKVDPSSECITTDHLNITKISNEINNTGGYPAHTISENHDAKSVDFGNSNYISVQQSHIFSEETVDAPASSEREVKRNDSLKTEQQALAEVQLSDDEFYEKNDPKDEVFVKVHLNVAQETKDSLVSSHESTASVLELLEGNTCLAEENSHVLKTEGADAESVISIPDSEDVASIHSQNDEKVAKNEDLIILQDKTLPNIESENQRDLNRDGQHEIQVSEDTVETVPYNELCSSSSLKFQYPCESIEHQATCEFLVKDADGSSFTEGDEELLYQNNFTLILEGDDEAEVGDSTVLHAFPLKPASPKSEGECNSHELTTNTVSTVRESEGECRNTSESNSHELTTNTVSTVRESESECKNTSGSNSHELTTNTVSTVRESEGECRNTSESNSHELTTNTVSTVRESENECKNTSGSNSHELTTNTVSTVTSDKIPRNSAEVLPYVPEPIQMAIAENLLDVIKDTRSKEFSLEIVEQSFHESLSKKVLNSTQAPVQNIHETNIDTELSRVENPMSGSSTIDQKIQTLNIVLSNDQPLTKNKSEILTVPTPRRSARRAKEVSDIPESLPNNSEGESLEEKISQTPNFLIRDVKERKKSKLEMAAAVHPTTSDRITRSITKNQQSNQFIIDHAIQMTVSRKNARKLKAIALQLAENVISDQEMEPQERQLSVTPRRGIRKKHDIMKAETSPEKSLLSSSVRKSRSRKSDEPETTFEQQHELQLPDEERTHNTDLLESISAQEGSLIEELPVRRKRGRPRKNSMKLSADIQLDSLLSSPDPKSLVTRRSTRSGALKLSTISGHLPSVEISVVDTPKRRSSRMTSQSIKKTSPESAVQPHELVTLAKRPGKRQCRITRIRKRSQLASVSEDIKEEEHSPLVTENVVGSESTDTARLRLEEIREPLAHHDASMKSTRYTQKKVKQHLSLDVNDTFFFSPPLTKLKEKPKGEKAVTPIQLKNVDADMASKFVFSPPVLRSQKKQISNISRIVEELELPIKEEKHAESIETLEKQKIKRRSVTRSKATKASKIIRKGSSWSPPAMEIKFISPFGTPVDETKQQGDSVGRIKKGVKKTLCRKEKRLSSYPKPVVQRKML